MFFRGFLTSCAAAVVLLVFGALGAPAGAVSLGNCFDNQCIVSDGDASIRFDAADPTSGDWELRDFFLGGVDHLHEEEWHLFVIDPDDLRSVDLNVDLHNNFDLTFANADEDTNTITVIFSGISDSTSGLDLTGLELTIDHVLTGGPGSGTLEETATLFNDSDNEIFVALSEYDDFDLGDSSGGDTVTTDGDTFTQTDGDITLGLTSSDFDFFGVGDCCESNLLDSLTDGDGHLGGETDFGPPGNAVFGTEYDITLAVADDPLVVTKVKTLSIRRPEAVPEPATLSLFGLGLAGLGAMRRRRRSRVASVHQA